MLHTYLLDHVDNRVHGRVLEIRGTQEWFTLGELLLRHDREALLVYEGVHALRFRDGKARVAKDSWTEVADIGTVYDARP
jgi:hypothetical protein